ncbi:hypothetical protein COLO4_31841 [Corchorus olitorius]|uniref:Uncharacterized protein n=1 Tax=Corchorus olitorius TaxID=93759 RepID=A0A1R3H376_9ROSI|nr:hypothetical protein COLO4_31841 [Corchorus olitorius]
MLETLLSNKETAAANDTSSHKDLITDASGSKLPSTTTAPAAQVWCEAPSPSSTKQQRLREGGIKRLYMIEDLTEGRRLKTSNLVAGILQPPPPLGEIRVKTYVPANMTIKQSWKHRHELEAADIDARVDEKLARFKKELKTEIMLEFRDMLDTLLSKIETAAANETSSAKDKKAFADILRRISKMQKTNGPSNYVVLRDK